MSATSMDMASATSAMSSMSMSMASMSSSMSSMMMDMSSSSMSMSMSMSSSTATGSSHDMSGMDMGSSTASASSHDMGGMDMSSSCKINMLWNWYTIDACFISKGWHVSTRGQFAGTCIGVFLWVVALELWRRMGREMDRYFVRSGSRSSGIGSNARDDSSAETADLKNQGTQVQSCCGGGSGAPVKNRFFGTLTGPTKIWYSPNVWQQALRALRYTVEFGAAYLLMLMAMYYNGYILITMWLGAFFGFFIFATDTVGCDTSKAEASCC